MNLIHYTPQPWFDFPFDRVFDEFFTRPVRGHSNGDTGESAYLPRVDIREEKDAVIVTAELPGVEKDNLKIELDNGVLTLSGEKKPEVGEEENGFYRAERAYGAFKRQFNVPEVVDAEKISAEYVNGILRITLPRNPAAAPRQIAITTENGAAKQIETKR